MITIKNLSKTIRRRKILTNINAELKGITGIIGPNGAGKTTLLKIISSIENGDKETEIVYKGQERKDIKIGYLPQNFNVYPQLTVYNVLKLLSRLKGEYDEGFIEELLTQMNLNDYKDEKVKNLSGGTLQRVGIAQALLNKPDYLIIDEPTTGLDIMECLNLRNVLLNISKDMEIIISSHIPEDITFICNHLIVINQGNKIFEGSLEELVAQSIDLTYETIINKNDIKDITKKGSVLNVEQLSHDKVKVRLVANAPITDPSFYKVESDFLSGYVSLLKGVI